VDSVFFVFEVFLGLGGSLVTFFFSDSDFHEVRAHSYLQLLYFGLNSYSDGTISTLEKEGGRGSACAVQVFSLLEMSSEQ